MASAHIPDDEIDRKRPYTVEELGHHMLMPLVEHTLTSEAVAGAPETPASGIIDLNDAKPQLDVRALLAAATAPGRFHENALPAVMSLISSGAPPDAVEGALAGAIAMVGYNVEQRTAELHDMVVGAVRKVAVAPVAPLALPPEPATDGIVRIEFPLLSLADLSGPQLAPRWRIKGVLPERGFGVTYGAVGAFKSFIVNDMALRIATGLDWCNRHVEPCPVVYIAGEGAHGFPMRVKAWMTTRGADLTAEQLAAARFDLLPKAVDMLDVGSVKRLADRLAELPQPPRVIFIDTMARMFGGGDENKSQDMNRFIAACEYLASRCSAFVMVVHHEGKDATRGERGSSALRGAEDVRFRLLREENTLVVDLIVEKMKDGEDGMKFRFRMNRTPVGVDEETGDEIISLYPVFEGSLDRIGKRAKIGKNEARILTALASGALSYGEIAKRTGIDERLISRSLKSLTDKVCVHRDGYLYRSLLVDGDETEVVDSAADGGGSAAADAVPSSVS